MKKDMPLEGLRWSRDSGSALYDTPQNGRSRTGWGGVSLYKSELEGKVRKHYRLCLAAVFLLFLILFFEPYEVMCIRANMRACLLAIAIVVLSMKVQVRNPSLSWLGKNLFPLYIYQRIGMIIFSRINEGEFIKDYPYLYIVLCVMITLLVGYMYKYIKIKI